MALNNKKVAFVINDSSFPDSPKVAFGPNTFNFKNLQNVFIDGYKQKFDRTTNKLDFYKNQAPSTGTSYAFYFYPEFKIKLVNDFWTSGCLVKYKLRILDGAKVLADESGEYKVTIWNITLSKACEEAIEEVFNDVTDRASARLR
jgi:hypothetical protein